MLPDLSRLSIVEEVGVAQTRSGRGGRGGRSRVNSGKESYLRRSQRFASQTPVRRSDRPSGRRPATSEDESEEDGADSTATEATTGDYPKEARATSPPPSQPRAEPRRSGLSGIRDTVFWHQRTRTIRVFTHPTVLNYIDDCRERTPDEDGKYLFKLLSEYTIMCHFAVCARVPSYARSVADQRTTMEDVYRSAAPLDRAIRGVARMAAEVEATRSNDQYNKEDPDSRDEYQFAVTTRRISQIDSRIRSKLIEDHLQFATTAARLEVAVPKFTEFARAHYSHGSSTRPTNRRVLEFYEPLDVGDINWAYVRPSCANQFFYDRNVASQRFIRWWKRQLMCEIDHEQEQRLRKEPQWWISTEDRDRPSVGVDGTFYSGQTIGSDVDSESYRDEFAKTSVEHVVPRSWTRNSTLMAESQDPDELPPSTVVVLSSENSKRGNMPLALHRTEDKFTADGLVRPWWAEMDDADTTNIRRQVAARTTAFGFLMTPLVQRNSSESDPPNPGIGSYRDQFEHIRKFVASKAIELKIRGDPALSRGELDQRARWELRFNLFMWYYFESAHNPLVETAHDKSRNVPKEWMWLLKRRFKGTSLMSDLALQEVTANVARFPQNTDDGPLRGANETASETQSRIEDAEQRERETDVSIDRLLEEERARRLRATEPAANKRRRP